MPSYPFEWISTELPRTAEMDAVQGILDTNTRLHPCLSNILAQRGITRPEQLKPFFRPEWEELHDPWLMQGMDVAAERMAQAIRNKERIMIYGDYDVDGTTAVALWANFLERLTIRPIYYIPDRQNEGYGVSLAGIDTCSAKQCTLLLTLDCGIRANEALALAKQRGIETIVCDHHLPDETLPQALAILDPVMPTCPYPNKNLTGCGIGFKLIQATGTILERERFLENGFTKKFLQEHAELVSLSIACDIVPVVGENRTLLSHGLQRLKYQPGPGMRTLMALDTRNREWNVSDLVFFIGPMINAAGRLGSALDAVELLRGNLSLREELAERLLETNENRKLLDQQATQEALAQLAADPVHVNAQSTVVYHPEWHKGVVGIVASRLIEHHYKPTLVFTKSGDYLTGSGRSVNGIHLHDAVSDCQEWVVQFGGHAHAVGITLEEEKFLVFREKFEAAIAARMHREVRPTLEYQATLEMREIDARFYANLSRLEPYGPGNMMPLFRLNCVQLTKVQAMKEAHLRAEVRQGGRSLKGIGFRMMEKYQQLGSPSQCDLIVAIQRKIWRQNTYIELEIRDIKRVEP